MCKCCNEIESIKESMKYTPTRHVLMASLADISLKGKIIKGTVTYAYYDLNYCPLCGRKVKKWKN